MHRLVRDMAAVVESRDGEIERLQLIIKKLQRAQFGRRSGCLDDDQLTLGLENIETDLAQAETLQPAPEVTSSDADERPRHKALPEHLPSKDVLVDIDAASCPCCGALLHQFGESVSKMLDWVPAEFRVVRIRRPKYGCRACGTIHRMKSLLDFLVSARCMVGQGFDFSGAVQVGRAAEFLRRGFIEQTADDEENFAPNGDEIGA